MPRRSGPLVPMSLPEGRRGLTLRLERQRKERERLTSSFRPPFVPDQLVKGESRG